MSWQYVEIDEVYLIHQAIIARAGTKASVRDFALLHSAVERPRATYGGHDLYPTVFTKGAALLQSLCRNHPFSDGNKRTAWIATKRLLHISGFHLKATKKESVELMVYVDNGKPSVKEIATWLKDHSSRESKI